MIGNVKLSPTTAQSYQVFLLNLANDQIDVTNELWYTVEYHSFGPPHVIRCLDDDDLLYLEQVYNLFFPGVSDTVIPRSYDKYASLECAGERFGSSFSRLNRCSYVLQKWAARFDGGSGHAIARPSTRHHSILF